MPTFGFTAKNHTVDDLCILGTTSENLDDTDVVTVKVGKLFRHDGKTRLGDNRHEDVFQTILLATQGTRNDLFELLNVFQFRHGIRGDV